jgi:hypothetical protein
MKYIITFSLLTLIACSSIHATDKVYNEEHDYHVLLSSLLNVNEDNFTYLDENGIKQPDSLKLFKELERIYSRNIKPDLPNEQFSKEKLKVIMYFSFYAHENNSAAFQEYLAEDLMPIYLNNMISFSEVLKELPFLIDSNCNRLNAYFGHEGKNKDKKNNFIANKIKLLSQNLTNDQNKKCIGNFKP